MKKALAIGIDTYLHMSKLDGCVNDAIAIEQSLSNQSSGFLVKNLHNDEATRANLQRDIKWTLKDASFSIIFFAGHGLKGDVATYLIPHDGDADDGIDVMWIQQAILNLAADDQTVLLLLDCCHSGAVPMGVPGKPLVPADLPVVPGRGRVLIAACGSDQQAGELRDSSGDAFGKFSYHFVRALQGHAANEKGTVTLSAAYDYVARQFQDEKTQIPVFRGDHEGIVELAAGVEPLGNWRPPAVEERLSNEAARTKGDELLARVRAAILSGSASNEQWKVKGYRNACSTYETVQKWFERVSERQPELLADSSFAKLISDLSQFRQQLGTLSVGTVLRAGEVTESLGSGTFGTVFTVAEAGAQAPTCFKLFHANDLQQKDKVARFRRGYEAMRQMDHPAIVHVREFSEVPLGFFMDYIPGANARHYLPGIVNDPPEVVRLLLEVAETLQHAHGKHVIHRDVKPENILIKVAEDGLADAFLTDFDLAWFDTATKLTKLAEGFGSHFYAAPEQMARPNSPAARSEMVDVYSFGQLTFYFLTGRDPVPMDAEGNAKALRSALSQYWTDPDQANALLDFYRSATHVDPKKRPTSFRDICQLLAKIELALHPTTSEYELGYFMRTLRFTVSGDLNDVPEHHATSFRSRSGLTGVSTLLATETQNKLALDVSFRPEAIGMEGMRAQDSRNVINQRIDAALQPFAEKHGVRRSGGKGGGFEANVRIEGLTKDADGVLRGREIISRVIDAIERT